jgi:hypothetical protein
MNAKRKCPSVFRESASLSEVFLLLYVPLHGVEQGTSTVRVCVCVCALSVCLSGHEGMNGILTPWNMRLEDAG